MGEFLELFNNTDVSTVSTSVKLLILLTVLSIAPGILIMLTSFTRIIIVLSFVRSALATNTMPPNQVLIGIAMFMTFFIMSPVLYEVNDVAITPLFNDEINIEEAYEKASLPFKELWQNILARRI